METQAIQKSLIAFGAPPGESSAGLAVSFAALVGALAGIPVVVIDLDPLAEISRHILGIMDPKGIEWLVESFLRDGQIIARQVQEQLVWHAATGYYRKGFYVLPGAESFSPQYRDRIAGARGKKIAECLLNVVDQLDHKCVVVNLGSNARSLLGEKFFLQAHLKVLVSANNSEAVGWAHPRFRYLLTEKMSAPHPGSFQYPSQYFARTLTRPYFINKLRMPQNASQIALFLAESLYPEIASMLVDETGRRIKPWRGTWFDRIFRRG